MGPQEKEKLIREKFHTLKVLVIGDVMVDEYITGKVSRISPEAPIPVLNYGGIRRVAGGAANVAHNIIQLGGTAAVLGVAGDDPAGRWMREYLISLGVAVDALIEDLGKPTTVKRRFATNSQQLLRVDLEDAAPIAEPVKAKILSALEQAAKSVDAVILSDYQKGVLSSVGFIRQLIQICQQHRVLVAVDSKSSDIEAFEHADFVKPNHLELERAVGIKIVDEASFTKAGNCYLERSGAKALLVTRGAKGISVFQKGAARKDYPAKDVQVYDVTGAGDTVISAVALGMAGGMPLEEAVVLGNTAAGVVISKVGTATVTMEELISHL